MKFLQIFINVPEIVRIFTKHFLSAAGIVGIIVTIFAAAENHPKLSFEFLLIGCFLACTLYSIIMIWPQKTVSIYLAPRKKVKIIQGDLFKQNGILVIPVNNYFDMTTVRDVIGPSVHYQFIKKYVETTDHPIADINQKITQTLTADGINWKGIDQNRNFPANRNYYELGTVARLFNEGSTFFLTVVSEFDNHNHVIKQPEKLGYTLQSMLTNINRYKSGHDVYMPVIGSGLLNMPMSIEELIEFMLDNIKFSDYNSTKGCINIVVRKEDMDETIFRVIQNHKSMWINKFFQ